MNPPDDDLVSPVDDTGGKWTLTKEALDKLLDHFSPNREEAARKYLVMQVKLIRYFEWQDCFPPEDAANETINRVARKIVEGEHVNNLGAYFSGVARNVRDEWRRRPDRYVQPIEDVPEIPAAPPPEDDQKEARLRCLDECLAKHSAMKRELILGYYSDVRRAKIDHRRKLAESATMNALRIRVCRIRKDVEKCVKECAKRISDSK